MTVGGDSSDVSALYVLRQYAMLRASTQRYKIGGGMDRLPGAMAASLAGIIRYNAPVVRVERQSTRFRVDYREGAAVRSVAAARVVFAVPASTMRQIEMKPRLSRLKEQAIEQLFGRRWHPFPASGEAPFLEGGRLERFRENRPGDRNLGCRERPARVLTRDSRCHGCRRDGPPRTRHTPEASLSVGVDLVADAFPGIRSEFEKGAVYRWSAEPWTRGAFAVYRPGQMTTLMPVLASAESGLHFAGEHTSIWTGWMEGALESGERAAREVLNATGRAWPEQTGPTR